MVFQRSLVRGIIVLVMCGAISACASQPSPTTHAPSPNATVQPTLTVTIYIQPTHPPTVVPQPSRTPSPRVPTRTIDPEHKATKEAEDVFATQVASFPVTCESALALVQISPGGTWLARICDETHTLEIVSQNGQHWLLEFKDFFDEKYRSYDPDGRLRPVHWVNDDYLYFTSHLHISGGGTCFYGFGVEGLYRFDLHKGTISNVLPPRPVGRGYLLTFSPKEHIFVYTISYSSNINFVDLISGETTNLTGDYGVPGTLTWSPDGSKVLFADCMSNGDDPETFRSSILIYDIATGVLRHILEKNNVQFYVDAVFPTIKVAEIDNQTNQVRNLFFNWDLEEITLTATPTP